MLHSRRFLLKSAAFAALFMSGAQAQALRCDLIQSNATCFDIDTLQGLTITVPSNVTRLENEGIQLCQGTDQAGGEADIAYVYDNSGSMNVSRYFISGTDTLYYYGTGGCTNAGTGQPTMTIQVWNAAGTAQVNRTVTRLASNANCNNFSGDPFNARGRAFRLGIQNQAARAPASMAGVMSFTDVVQNIRRPMVLNPANLATIIGGINAVSSGGTGYGNPLDTSRTWLRTATITPQTPGRTKATIFLSDGQPTQPTSNPLNYLPLNPATPPIYGIFLGRDTTNTGRLRELAALSGGQFFLIPPNRPNDLVAVIDSILGIILVQYNPMALSITNNTNAQTSLGSLVQTTGGNPLQPIWRVSLDNVIGLNTGVNSMSITHAYLEIRNNLVTDTVQTTTTFNISATGAPATATTITPIPNAQGSTFATRCYAPSRIQWQTAAGVRPAFFTETDSTNVRLRLRTAASDSNDLSFVSNNSTRRNADWENSTLPQSSHVADSTIFILNPVPMNVTAGPAGGNLILEPFYTDSMIASWVHPRDTRDFARDTIPVFPSNQAADVWFSNTPGGAPVTFFPATTTTVYIVVSDNRARAGFTYQVAVSSDGLGDNQIFALTETSPGIFSATVPITVSATPIGGDGRVQVSAAGDQLRVIYIDPVFNDRDEATAGFGISVQESPDLVFTDAAGTPFPNPNTSLINPVNPYSLTAGSVYLRYRDDSINIPVNVTLTVRSFRLGQQVSTDAEAGAMAPQTAAGTARNWTAVFPLAEASTPGPVPGNGIVQGAYLIQVTAVVPGHDNIGDPTAGDTAVLIIARPDQAASLAWAQQVNVANPRGPVDIIDTLRDQDFLLSNSDTVFATAYCPASGDSVSGWRFIQASPTVYVSEPLVRGPLPPNFTDRILACAAGDSVVVRYTDPVYGSVTTQSIREVMPPTANPVSGTGFPSTLDVTLSTVTPGAAINYTMNNTVPAPGQPTLYTATVQLLATTTLEAVASAPNMLRSRVSTFTYTRTPLPSELEIRDANNNPIPVSPVTNRRTVTDAATSLRMRLFTSQGGLGQVTVDIRSATLGDDEASVLIDPPATTLNGTVYGGPIPLRGGAAVPADLDDTLQTGLNDMIIATWTNPLNALDVVRDTVWIEPAYVAPVIRFTDAAGTDVTTYPTGTTTIYVRVNARNVPGNTYSVVVSSTSNGADNETFTYPATLSLVNGVFVATITVNLNAKASGNGTLQVFAAGDQLTASFTDPVFALTVTDQAAYNAVPEVTARIEFLDNNGVVLANGVDYSPANGQVTVRYYDDWSAGINALINPKKPLNFTLAATNNGVPIGTDIESDSMFYNPSGYWERVFPLRDAALVSGNGSIESQFLGNLTVSVASHNNAGNPDGASANATLVIRYPNQTPVIEIKTPGGEDPGRVDTAIVLIITDQPHTSNPGATVTATLTCTGTGDAEVVTLVGDGLGGYRTPTIPKNENPPNAVVSGDGILTCRETDAIRVIYVDPVFGTPVNPIVVSWDTPAGVSVRFVLTSDTSVAITSSSDTSTSFTVIINTATITIGAADVIGVIVRTPQGDLDTLWAVETSATSGRFVVAVPFGFSLNPPVTGSGSVEGQLNPVLPNNSVPATVVVHRTPADSGSAIITLFSTFVPSNGGYVKDLNGDGRADAVYLTFAGPITLPARIDTVYWNTGTSNGRPATVLSLAANGTMLVANLSATAFPSGPGMTGIPNPLSPPTAVLPAGTAFGGARVTLADSVGAVPLRAVKRPSDLRQNPTTGVVNPDTIEVTVSEPITSDRADWRGVFRFTTSTNCLDPTAIQRSVAISVLFVTPSVNGTVFTMEVGNALGSSNPLVGNCIFLDTTGITQDAPGNKSGIVGVPLEGSNPNQAIRVMVGAPPVVGLSGPVTDVSNPADPRLQRTNLNEYGWVAPIGFPVGWVPGQPLPNPPVTGRPGDPVDTNSMPPDPGITRIPDGISAVLVVTTSRYFAHINLFDHLGHFVKSWDQKFGYNGEMNYGSSQTSSGVASYLWWDQYDYKGRKAGQGVYIWKVTFEYVAGNGQTRQETRIIRTGLMR